MSSSTFASLLSLAAIGLACLPSPAAQDRPSVVRLVKTDQHDVETKINQARKFLEHKDKVLVYVLYKGRELQHIEEGKRILELILEKLGDSCKVEQPPRMEGKRMSTMLAPK